MKRSLSECVVFVFWGGCITFEWDYSYLLQRDLVVSVEIHGGKQRVWAVSQPHKHVPVWHTLAQAQQLQLKEQYRTFRDTRGWGETVELVKSIIYLFQSDLHKFRDMSLKKKQGQNKGKVRTTTTILY